MRYARQNWFVVTGPPCSGKSVTIEGLAGRGFRVRREIARAYIDEQVGTGRRLDDLRLDMPAFQLEILRRAVASEAALPPREQIFLDRAVPDSLSYFRMHGIEEKMYHDLVPVPSAYGSVFALDPVPNYLLDYARSETTRERELLHQLVTAIYEEAGVEVHRVPMMAADERISFIVERLPARTAH